jgi:hypothetical protein
MQPVAQRCRLGSRTACRRRPARATQRPGADRSCRADSRPRCPRRRDWPAEQSRRGRCPAVQRRRPWCRSMPASRRPSRRSSPIPAHRACRCRRHCSPAPPDETCRTGRFHSLRCAAASAWSCRRVSAGSWPGRFRRSPGKCWCAADSARQTSRHGRANIRAWTRCCRSAGPPGLRRRCSACSAALHRRSRRTASGRSRRRP